MRRHDTLTTALASLLTGVLVPLDTAMTCKVSLQGDVNPIGGLSEKLMAAQRSGVMGGIPNDHADDLKDVADEVKQALTITLVSIVTKVLRALGIPVRYSHARSILNHIFSCLFSQTDNLDIRY